MATQQQESEQTDEQATPWVVKHFWLAYIGSFALTFLVSCHAAFSVLPLPVIASGITTESHTVYKTGGYSKYGRRNSLDIEARTIHYAYQGKDYDIMGGWDEEEGRSVPVHVIFNATQPQKAFELSLGGLMDFRIMRFALPAWIILSGFLFAFASSDSHFTATYFNIPRLTAKSFMYKLIIVLAIPLFPSTDLLLFGKHTTGTMGDDADQVDGHFCRPIFYDARGQQYALHSAYADEYERKTGNQFSVIYMPGNPQRSCLFQVGPLYDNGLTIVMGMSLLLLLSWFAGSWL